MQQFRPPLTTPDDFDVFWQRTREEIEGISPVLGDPSASASPVEGGSAEGDSAGWCHRPLHLASLGGARLGAYALGHIDEAPRPLVIHAHGYHGQYAVRRYVAKAGCNVVGVDIRGFGRSAGACEMPDGGFMTSGLHDPASYYLRGAVCDYAQAIRVGCALFPNRTRLVLHGFSFAGGLALMAQFMLGSPADFLALGVPTFGWAQGRRRLVRWGSGKEVNDYIAKHPALESKTMDLLRYFDTMNFAPKIHTPVLFGLGLEDGVVPPETVYAIANHWPCRHEVMEFPVSHSDSPLERHWAAFERRWLRLACEGVPGDFGLSAENAPTPESASSASTDHPGSAVPRRKSAVPRRVSRFGFDDGQRATVRTS